MYVEVLAENDALAFYRKYGGEIVEKRYINGENQRKILEFILKFSTCE